MTQAHLWLLGSRACMGDVRLSIKHKEGQQSTGNEDVARGLEEELSRLRDMEQ